MKIPTKVAPIRSKRAKKISADGVKPEPAGSKRVQKSATNIAIATELAPAVAIALLEKIEQSSDDAAPAPALDCLAAAAVHSETTGKVRVQFLFENGAVLPVEMSAEAGAALSKGLADELPQK